MRGLASLECDQRCSPTSSFQWPGLERTRKNLCSRQAHPMLPSSHHRPRSSRHQLSRQCQPLLHVETISNCGSLPCFGLVARYSIEEALSDPRLEVVTVAAPAICVRLHSSPCAVIALSFKLQIHIAVLCTQGNVAITSVNQVDINRTGLLGS